MSCVSCKNCGTSINTHHRCSLTCGSCGHPYGAKIEDYLNMTVDLDSDDVSFYCVSAGPMYHYTRALMLKGVEVKIGGEPVFVNKKGQCYAFA